MHGAVLKEGNADRTLSDLIGIHPDEGLLVIVDEATDVTPAVLDAITNWDSGGVNFQMIVVGNSKSQMDVHGKLSQPKNGWASLNPDVDEQWETENGICLFSDCYKSPAVLHPDNKALQFLMTPDKIKREAERLGVNHPQFWRFVRGFWPPDDLTKTVLTPTMIDTHNAQGNTEWYGTEKVTLAALDPAFTSDGDECILRFADLGMNVDGQYVLDFGGEENIHALQIDVTLEEPTTYQIVRMAKRECLARGVKPEHLGIDTWGFGAGAGDVIEKQWSPNILRVNGIGIPSEMYVDIEQTTTANEVYDRRITELWFIMREFVQAGQIRGLDEATCEEFCSREYDDSKRKYRLETKNEYKKRMGKGDGPTGSPDRADAAAILLDVARQAFNFLPGKKEIQVDEREEWEERWEEMMFSQNENEWEASRDSNAIEESAMFEDVDQAASFE